jgi:23S rRNA pseudouridine1911/1915/1917 synthase
MDNHTFTVANKDAGLRLDRYLAEHFLDSISRTYLQKLIRQKKVLVNGVPRKNHYKVEVDDLIEIEITEPEKIAIEPENIPLNIIFEDERLIVVDKPAGMVVHPAPGNYSGTLVNAVLYHIKRRANFSEVRPGIVHRLDKNTSGLLIVAKDEASHLFLSRQFNKRTTDKRYITVVEDIVQLDNGVILYPIGRHPRDRKKMAVKFSSGAKKAITYYRVLERFKDTTLLEIKPETGRTHQIRVHMAYIGHPIVGDNTYGKRKKNMPINRQALHAAEISFLHPTTEKPMHFISPLPNDMMDLIHKLKSMR